MSLYALMNSLIRDSFFRIKFATEKNVNLDERISSAMNWLCLAQDVQTDGGVALKYSLISGWSPSYPETTGYIIPTFIRYSQILGDKRFLHRAIKMANWLMSIQRDDGSFKGGDVSDNFNSFVFDTGQIVFGLIAAYNTIKDTQYLERAVKAGNWLVNVQDNDGAWRDLAYYSIPHTYYTRVAWALAKLGILTGDNTFSNAACKNIDWALSKQRNNGWFDCAGFIPAENKAPFTHTIAYSIRGILETGVCLNRNEYIAAARRSAEALVAVINRDNFCAGTYDQNWMPVARYSCLTGNAQIAIIFFKLYEKTNYEEFLNAGILLNRFLCQNQRVNSTTPLSIYGGIAGSYPIWGEYMRLSYVNWAAKFFIDSLLIEKNLIHKTTFSET